MEEKSVGRSFLILSMAGILVKLLSAAYIPLLNAAIGPEAVGVYNASYNIFIFILAITSMGAQPAVMKVVAELRALGHHEDALRAMKLSRNYLTIIGSVITVLVMVFAKPIAKMMNWEQAAISMMFLAPTILLTCVLAAYRGYLQGIEDMKTLAISQVLEQLVNVVLSLVFAFLLIKVSIEWGSAGGTVGTTIGALVAIVFIIYIYQKNNYEEEAYSSNLKVNKVSDKKILKKLLVYGIPIILVAAMQNAGSLIDTFIVKTRLLSAGFSDSEANIRFAILGYYNTLLYVPLSIVTALSAAIFPKIIQAFVGKNKKELRLQIRYSLRITYLITIPAAVGLAILSKEIYAFLFNINEGYQLLMLGSIVLVFMSITTIQNTILQGVSKLYLVLTTAFIGIVIKFVINYILVGIKDINVLGAMVASLFAFLIPAIINHRKLQRIFKIRIPIIREAIMPTISSIAMAISIYLCKLPFDRIINIFTLGRAAMAIEVVLLIGIGGIVYLVVMVFLGGISKKDLDLISPKLFTLMPRFLRKQM